MVPGVARDGIEIRRHSRFKQCCSGVTVAQEEAKKADTALHERKAVDRSTRRARWAHQVASGGHEIVAPGADDGGLPRTVEPRDAEPP